MKIASSEWVSLGHPDKLADYITSYILDRYLAADPDAHYAVEVLIKDSSVFLAGEVSCPAAQSGYQAIFDYDDLFGFVQDAIHDVGYTREYQDVWGKQNTISGDYIEAEAKLSRQSADIARGVGRGWGDQGIFWGMAVATPEHDFLPADYWFAREIGRRLFASGIGGLDIKTLVSTNDDTPYRVVVAIPLLCFEAEEAVRHLVRSVVGDGVEIVLNGTGRFVTHGPIGDSGVTGRKLAVDFYGGNCRIGGGSPWGKDASKADVALNIYARKLALAEVARGVAETCFCSIACAIGQPDLEVALYDAEMRQIRYWREARPAYDIIDELGLRKPCYASMCRNGLFSRLTMRP